MFPIENIIAVIVSVLALLAIFLAVYKAVQQFYTLMNMDRMNRRYREIFSDHPDDRHAGPANGSAETNF
uniref:Col_cuticle_N domain-containing protein n=1 Tax=Caenorhabditis tropicalis TaxID=1561998 RepID=A0A1I7TBQ4_9PELO